VPGLPDSRKPRYFIIGSTLGSLPRQAEYIFARGVLCVAARQYHLPEPVAIGARQTALLLEPLVRVVIEHLRPQIGVVASRVAAVPNLFSKAFLSIVDRSGGGLRTDHTAPIVEHKSSFQALVPYNGLAS